MTLRLAAMDRYQVQASDPVGRGLWSLDVTGERGLFLNHRARTFCTFEGSFDLSGVPLGPFPLLTLPTLLIGRVPSQPASQPDQQGRQVTFRDTGGRLWSALVDADGEVESWSLSEGGEPSAWWVRRESWAILSDRERGVQVRWREVLREPLEGAPAALETPAGYRAESCREPTLMEPSSPGPLSRHHLTEHPLAPTINSPAGRDTHAGPRTGEGRFGRNRSSAFPGAARKYIMPARSLAREWRRLSGTARSCPLSLILR